LAIFYGDKTIKPSILIWHKCYENKLEKRRRKPIYFYALRESEMMGLFVSQVYLVILLAGLTKAGRGPLSG